MKNFTIRLRAMMNSGDLTMADTATLFSRERRTVASWVKDARVPVGARANEAFAKLKQLEDAIDERAGFPIPLQLSKRDRAKYVRNLGVALERARVLATGPASERLVRRPGAKKD